MNNETSNVPYLVTRWLSEYAQRQANDTAINTQDKQDSIKRIQQAARTLANEFSRIGAFGSTLLEMTGHSELESTNLTRNATYTDVSRKWQDIPHNQLESMVASSAGATAAVMNSIGENERQASLMDVAHERELQRKYGLMKEPEIYQNSKEIEVNSGIVASTLQKPVLLTWNKESTSQSTQLVTNRSDMSSFVSSTNERNVRLVIGSDFHRMEQLYSQSFKRYLQIREKYDEEKRNIMQIKRSLAYQNRAKSDTEKEIETILQTTTASSSQNDSEVEVQQKNSDILAQQMLEIDRAVAQLTRKLSDLTQTHETESQQELNMSKSIVNILREECMLKKQAYGDPNRDSFNGFHDDWRLHISGGSKSILNYVIAQSYGVNLNHGQRGPMRKNIGGNVTKRALAQRCKQLFCNRISHVVTINAHLFYPVYCLRFDRTGRFFVTGSDDNIVKLFKLGSVGCDIKAKRGIGSIQDNFSDQRGAVLICTLRGHASVITDIDVSSDNSLLATASEDGDVRIWGMTNGCPVAILRGHEGGANMVSWSTMTPYRLVTISQDGFARLWDIRDAALKRCTTIRNRSEYMVSSSRNNDNIETLIDASDDVVLPPIHPPNAPNEQLLAHDVPRTEHNNNRTGIYVPPLPPGAEMGIGAENISLANGENVPAPGEFVANNEIDEGVQLLTQFQHGDAPSEDQYQGTGTRSRRKKIKVICLSRCPAGGHFATGSDDGIGRIWLDEDDESIAKLDDSIVQDMTNLLPDRFRDVRGRRRSARTNDSFNATCSALLASLHGHHNDITDIKYSSIGDRLLTASQKDGVVRIWSWGSESPKGSADGSIKIDQIRQIFLRLEPPPNINTAVSSSADNSGPVARRRASASSLQQSLHVFCDLATWSSDDSKVITSQTCVTKLTDTEIVPGSQVLYVWDSLTGSCLLGIPSAHVKACTVVAPHPLDASIIMSAGLDGFIKIWDLEYGKCEFSFLNTHEYGCLENLSDKGKTCGYLDGTFSPDGMNLVLTDDTGRITVLDALGNSRKSKDSSEQDSNTISNEERAPLWMQEQYFANDYYELFYDRNGYCIERGSRLPPHLAPGAARCNHVGHAYSDLIQRLLVDLKGPLPVTESKAKEKRDEIRELSVNIRKAGGLLSQNVLGKRNLVELRPDVASHIKTNITLPKSALSTESNSPTVRTRAITREQPGGSRRNMSSNYRWLDFDEGALNDDESNDDSNDEDFREGRRILNDDEDDDEDESLGDYNNQASVRRRRMNALSRRNRRRRQNAQTNDAIVPIRSSTRQTSRRINDDYIDESDEDVFEEMLSNNTQPFGEYITDYTELGHLFKLPREEDEVHRDWTLREDCVDGYTGWKTYCPQVGDIVAYIPRLHSQTLISYPICELSSGAPWKGLTWQKSHPWPVVECKVKNIRYRFPYSGYFGNKSRNAIKSVIAILTLEIVGIPQYTRDREVPWCSPDFVPRPTTRSSAGTFEVSIFESSEPDFVLPIGLYQWRLRQLESKILERSEAEGIEVTDFYVSDGGGDEKIETAPCQIVYIQENFDQELHFQNSGYNALKIKYETSDEGDACPWDISIRGKENEAPLPESLSSEQKRVIFSILDDLEKDEYVYSVFSAPVDTRVFVDYLQMIEVPMDISFIRRRLSKNYYTNVLSIVADMKLIRDNCLKYNKQDSEISKEGEKLYVSFSQAIDDQLSVLGFETVERTTRKSTRSNSRTGTQDSQGIIEGRRSTRLDREATGNDYADTTSAAELTSRTVRTNTRANRRALESSDSENDEGTNDKFSSSEDEKPSQRKRRAATKRIHESEEEDFVDDDDDDEDEDEEIEYHDKDDLNQEVKSFSRKRRVKYTQKLSESEEEDDAHKEDSTERISPTRIKIRRSSRSHGAISHGEANGGSPSRLRSRSDRNSSQTAESSRSSRKRSAMSPSSQLETLPSPKSKKNTSHASRDQPISPVPSSGRKSSRLRAQVKYHDFDLADLESEESNSNTRLTGSRSRTKKMTKSLETSPERHSSRQRAVVQYQDFSNSELDSDDDTPKIVRKPTKKRSTERTSHSPPSKKPKRETKDHNLPQLSRWPAHVVKPEQLKKVCTEIIRRVELFDAEGLFHSPVLEVFPEVAEKYLEVVDTPMDLKTIKKQRMKDYRVIGDLQKDLELIFKNCCTFNKPNSEYWKYAVEIWFATNDIFKETLESLNIDLPRRFN